MGTKVNYQSQGNKEIVFCFSHTDGQIFPKVEV